MLFYYKFKFMRFQNAQLRKSNAPRASTATPRQVGLGHAARVGATLTSRAVGRRLRCPSGAYMDGFLCPPSRLHPPRQNPLRLSPFTLQTHHPPPLSLPRPSRSNPSPGPLRLSCLSWLRKQRLASARRPAAAVRHTPRVLMQGRKKTDS
jgi:hypothetical protein